MRRMNSGWRNRACVYLLQRLDRKRFKVGWARNPLVRIRAFPEFSAGLLDLKASRVLWLPNRPRAEQVERSLQKCLMPYGTPVGHISDGHSEWFEGVAFFLALRMLSQMPLDERSDRRSHLVPLQAPLPPPDAVGIETGPVDTWWALEDLWARASMHGPLSVQFVQDCYRVTLHGLKPAQDGPLGALRREALEMETYHWRTLGLREGFVRLVAWHGDDLVCTLTPMSTIEGWPDGGELVWQVNSFLLRLMRMNPPMRSAGSLA